MTEHLDQLKALYRDLEVQIAQAAHERDMFARAGELTEAREAEIEMLDLIHEKDRLTKRIIASANSLDEEFGSDPNRSIPA